MIELPAALLDLLCLLWRKILPEKRVYAEDRHPHVIALPHQTNVPNLWVALLEQVVPQLMRDHDAYSVVYIREKARRLGSELPKPSVVDLKVWGAMLSQM